MRAVESVMKEDRRATTTGGQAPVTLASSPAFFDVKKLTFVNAEKIRVTGDKLRQKSYFRHSGYPGGLREERLEQLLERKPELVIERAVKGMLPQNRLGRAMFKKLKVYSGAAHPHQAQQPTAVEL